MAATGNSRPEPFWCLLAAWAIPGAGHLMLGMRGRALQYFLCVAVTFLIGVGITRGFAVSWEDHKLALALQAPVGVPTLIGLLYDESREPEVDPPSAKPRAMTAGRTRHHANASIAWPLTPSLPPSVPLVAIRSKCTTTTRATTFAPMCLTNTAIALAIRSSSR